jgi:ABC-type phosphate transport system substrate-binding protein
MTNAKSGKYKYVRNLYWVTKGAPAGNAKKFIDWSRTKTAQDYVGKEFIRIR